MRQWLKALARGFARGEPRTRDPAHAPGPGASVPSTLDLPTPASPARAAPVREDADAPTIQGRSDLPVFGLDHPFALSADALRALIGGKAASLVAMRGALGLPVPPGFVLGTPLCARVLDHGWPAGLSQRIDAEVARLERATQRVMGDAHRPLLVSVRSGAAVSMPGMMDTLLNLGANPLTIDALARQTGDARFALGTWLRFVRQYAVSVLGVDEAEMPAAPPADADERVLRDAVLAVRSHCERRGTPIPDHPRDQLHAAIGAVFGSSRSERARRYAARESMPEVPPTAVVVQAMVFGNLGSDSGTGVAFSRDPSTGLGPPCGDFLPDAQGEDVVGGTRPTLPLAAMRDHVPQAHEALMSAITRLEAHYRDLCDIEFTVQEGRLYLLQARPGKRAAIAAVRLAVALVDDPAIRLSRAEALGRVSREHLQQLQSRASWKDGAPRAALGIGASPGVVSGIVCTDPDQVAVRAAGGQRVILVRDATSPHDVHGMIAAAGILTATGGMVSHAALVARAWGIAAVCGASALRFDPDARLHDEPLRDGEVITIDGTTGEVCRGDWAQADGSEPAELAVLRTWAAEQGVVLGEAPPFDPIAPAPGDTALGRDREEAVPPDRLGLLRAIALGGFSRLERLAASLGTDAATVQAQLDALPPDHALASPRGWHLGTTGKTWLAQALAEERARIDPTRAAALYEAFMRLDARYKALVTEWQLRTVDGRQAPNDHGDAAHDQRVLAGMRSLHDEFAAPMAEAIALLPRLATYRRRFQHAAAAIAGGDHTMIASPLKDSYHGVWFEWHEELIHLAGRDRMTEETAQR